MAKCNYTCGDCLYAKECEENPRLRRFSRENPAYCKSFKLATDVVEVSEIKAYLQQKLDEWNELGERKFEPANMWGYNFIMACFDDLERRESDEAD